MLKAQFQSLYLQRGDLSTHNYVLPSSKLKLIQLIHLLS